ncbi:spore germination protein [Caloramator sp. E03]|uniref:spore germination protein n=1 Tax=Caloramator sp. E03 TaxID=2576307 RepID=UPI0011103C4E|nr:spore germination protein [Caloramator sp. E03]QCX33149.1 spore germination protein [Caloramator sp. E03]
MNEQLKNDIKDNYNQISSNISSNFNFIKREITIFKNIICYILYISGLSDKNDIQDNIIKPLLQTDNTELINSQNIMQELINKYIYSSEIEKSSSLPKICSELINGKCVILIQNQTEAIICNTVSSKYRQIQESTTEKSIQGSKESFVENIDVNIALLQRKLKNSDFRIERFVMGSKTNTEIVLTYIDKIIDPTVLDKIKSKILTISTPALLSPGFLEQFFDERTYNIFPMSKITEKPDKAAFDLLEGKAVIFISECPSALIVPATFIEFFQGFEDYSDKTIIACFSRILRFIAIITIIILEPIYLILLYYNPELFPYGLITIVISSRQNIPLPPLLEILAMDLAVEILREGGIRLPNPIGTTLAIVGGIVIGDSATKAGLVSYTTLFIVAITVISTFIIPNYQMALTIRFLRFPLLILSQFLGFFGLLIGLYLVVIILIKLEIFGVAYLAPVAPLRFVDMYDLIIRAPLRKVLLQPRSLKPSKKTKK